MDRTGIIEKIRKRMDEWTPFDTTPMLLGANEAMQPVGYQIEEVLDTCTDFILRNAPLSCVVPTNVWPLPNVTVIDNTGYVPLPDNFLRMNRVMFNDWLNPVQIFHEYNSKTSDMQRFPWIRGGRRKPVCVLNETGGNKILECRSTGGGITELVYVVASHFDATDKNIMNDEAIDLLMSYVASVIYNRMNEPDFEKIALQAYLQTEQRIKLRTKS
jgi:hypothetical protein